MLTGFAVCLKEKYRMEHSSHATTVETPSMQAILPEMPSPPPSAPVVELVEDIDLVPIK